MSVLCVIAGLVIWAFAIRGGIAARRWWQERRRNREYYPTHSYDSLPSELIQPPPSYSARPSGRQAATVNSAKRPGRRRWLDAARHPTRRDGAVLWVLLLLPWGVALVRHRHLDVAAVTILLTVSLGPPTLWVAWAGHRGPRRSGTRVSGLSMAQVADQLAVAVGRQWNDEAPCAA